MPSHDDVLIRAAFHELRASERGAAPRFRIIRLSGQAGLPVLQYVRAFALVLLVVLPFFAIVRKQAREVPVISSSLKAPTDFLLQTPQIDMLRDIPQFGERKITR